MERSKTTISPKTLEDIPSEDKSKGYRLKQVIGEGGFGYVYCGDRKVVERVKCAFKVLKGPVTPEDLKEIEIVQKINHKNVNKYLDFFINSENKLVIVQEFAAHGSLHDYLKKLGESQMPSEQQVLKWFRMICLGV